MNAQRVRNIKVVLGTMTVGKAGNEGVRVTTLANTSGLLDIFQRHGHVEVDTARVYGNGSSEELLGAIGWQHRGLQMATKLYPTSRVDLKWMSREEFTHSPVSLREGLMTSLVALKAEKIDLFYLHGPDRKTPFRETLGEINKLHQQGHFERFGISNFHSWEVAEICEICKANNWIMPSVYQGLYNAYYRVVEDELISCLRHYNVSLYVYNPLAGGLLTGRYYREQDTFQKGERFDPSTTQGKFHRNRYWNDVNFAAAEILTDTVSKLGISASEAALRWLAHHSALEKDRGDAVVVGASSQAHLEENLAALEKGPLPIDVLEALDAGWAKIRPLPLKFWH
ncbi:NADP-dependent oxidoreductase domain-containing protein [Pyrenochaeta sp. MPI-SDFR-AT-0127]|nr:NADP-dependent oxidoreductase domain-containing protein [Pyrenochaeta sp. MPI-SDFR-AT-0127]